ncbi:MAG TPA: cytochrome c oxidase subunit 3 family protein [Anaeromyxobacteraceae bacterium]|nr:cytochrome c oxidase subunit 3 family protein [Anaeromyxobacteraceae bacterium]
MRTEAEVTHGGEGVPHLAHHYSNLEMQAHAARLGMWLFLATEVLLFGGLFTAYVVYRYTFSDTFVAASKLVETHYGAINTVVLITSSLTVALAHHFVEHRQSRKAALLLAASVFAGLVFLGIKAIEYTHHIEAGELPGRYYSYEGLQAHGAAMFWSLYFLMTGLHGIHVIIGMGVLAVIAFRTWRGAYDDGYSTPVELSGLYWHLVDLIWIFLFPLFYLI